MSSITNNVLKDLFHYTSTKKAKEIKSNQEISQRNNKILLTTLRPEEHYRDEILRNNYGPIIPHNLKNMADNVVLVDYNELDNSKLKILFNSGRILFEYEDDISVLGSHVIDKPQCTKPNKKRQSSQRSGMTQTNGNQQANNSKYFYHYTSKELAQKISREGTLRMSNGKVILTTLAPENYYRNEILKHIYGSNYDPNSFATFADYCIKLDNSQLDPNKLINKQAHIFEYQGDISVRSCDVADKPRCTKSQINNDYLYHYTNKKGADAIKAAKFLKKSGPSGAFGVGVYMTDLRPTDFFRDDILKNNYGGISAAFYGRADWVVRIHQSILNQSQLRKVSSNVTRDGTRSIYVYPEIIPVSSNDVFDKPPCYRAK